MNRTTRILSGFFFVRGSSISLRFDSRGLVKILKLGEAENFAVTKFNLDKEIEYPSWPFAL